MAKNTELKKSIEEILLRFVFEHQKILTILISDSMAKVIATEARVLAEKKELEFPQKARLKDRGFE